MNRLRRAIPFLILLLVLAFFLCPSQDRAASPASEAAAAAEPPDPSRSPHAPSATELSKKKKKSKTTKPSDTQAKPADDKASREELLPEDGSYTTKEDVSLYLIQYGHLPSNFITKKAAREAGWEGGSLERILPGMCIGGDYFGNYENQLPTAKGRRWNECDINTLGARSRGAERLIYSNDGLIYYTDDHYNTFTQLY